MVGLIKTYGGEGVTYSKINNNILFVADNVFGIKIFNLTYLQNPIQLYSDASMGTSY